MFVILHSSSAKMQRTSLEGGILLYEHIVICAAAAGAKDKMCSCQLAIRLAGHTTRTGKYRTVGLPSK